MQKNLYLYNTSTKISELIWDEKVLYNFGASFSFKIQHFSTELSFSTALPTPVGEMHDYDWNISGININHTISKNSLLSHYNVDLKVYIPINVNNKFELIPSISFLYFFTNFHAYDGYGWYGSAEYAKIPRDYDVSWDNPLARKAKLIQPIDYYRNIILSFVGFHFLFNINTNFDLNFGLFVSPFIYNYSLDTHFHSSENIHYVDTQLGCFSKYKIECELNYKISSLFTIFSSFETIFGIPDFGELFSDEYSDSLSKHYNQPTSSNFWNTNFFLGTKITL